MPSSAVVTVLRSTASRCTSWFGLALSLGFGWILPLAAAPPAHQLDLADQPLQSRTVLRILGARGTGAFGVPVAGGPDVDGDGVSDLAVAHFMADVDHGDGVSIRAGEVDLVFLDPAAPLRPAGFYGDLTEDSPRLLRIFGAQTRETAGNEIWIDDVTGDGLGDLLIGRQNFAPDPDRPGAGALTVIPGSPQLRQRAEAGETLDLSAAQGLGITSLWGAAATDRLGIWMRTGDVDGDGVTDVVVGADQSDRTPGGTEESNRGEAWIILGGPHLASGENFDLADFHADGLAGTLLAGRVAWVVPPPDSSGFHLGATCQVAELDDDGRADVMVAAALNRAGASLAPANAPGSARPVGGAPNGRMWILWGDSLPATPWPAGLTVDLGAGPETITAISGGALNRVFGEEVGGGLDHDGDGRADFFVGDLTGGNGGLGYLFFDAAAFRGRSFTMDDPPADVAFTTFLPPNPGAIAGDTIVAGDFDGDDLADLAYASPHANPLDRFHAGTVHVVYGRSGPWPTVIDLRPGELPGENTLGGPLRVSEIQGARGRTDETDQGDTLAYSAAAADLDGDGLPELIVNEMLGNGSVSPDVGNLLVLPAPALAPRPAPLAPRRLAP